MQLTHNTLSENIRFQSVELLNKHLAAAIDLHAQVKQRSLQPVRRQGDEDHVVGPVEVA